MVMAQRKAANRRTGYNITGVAGEYFVAAELSRRGWVATLTLKNTPNIDVIATTPDGSRTVKIQVKTRSVKNRHAWVFNKGVEALVRGHNFYIALVDLKGEGRASEPISGSWRRCRGRASRGHRNGGGEGVPTPMPSTATER
jgi:Holliday junction resolvase-like predicted endonuclease